MPSTSSPPTTLSKEHIFFCFDAIDAELHGKERPSADGLPDANEKFPLFVTWNIYSSSACTGEPRLRGCIGTFEPTPLRESLADYASISAFQDRRFNPITQKELPRLQCGVSLLTNFEECEDYLDWEVGTHGIYIDFPHPALKHGAKSNGGSYGRSTLTATYLPEVAPAQGWTKQEAIDSAIEKAGWHGPITEELRKSLHVRRYRSEKGSVDYKEWKDARQGSA